MNPNCLFHMDLKMTLDTCNKMNARFTHDKRKSFLSYTLSG
jgi:hypothetical protein